MGDSPYPRSRRVLDSWCLGGDGLRSGLDCIAGDGALNALSHCGVAEGPARVLYTLSRSCQDGGAYDGGGDLAPLFKMG